MKVRGYDDPRLFRDTVSPFLLEDERENHLIISIITVLVEYPARYHNPYLALVEDAGRIEAVGIMTPPHNLLLTRSGGRALTAILDDLLQRGIPFPGAAGPDATALEFCKLVRAKNGRSFHRQMAQRSFALTEVKWPTISAGRFRAAGSEDFDTLVSYCEQFNVEAGVPAHRVPEDTVRDFLAAECLYVWLDTLGQIVSMAARSPGATPNGARVQLVFTPKSQRNKGYASSIVAHLSQLLLDSGKRLCFLYTDLSNPTSNKIYQQIGYSAVCDFSQYDFD